MCFDVVSFKAAKTNIAVFFSTFCDTSEEFISLCLLFALFMWVLFVYSVFVCLSLLFLIRSQQSVARWELSLSTYWLLIIPNPLPPICETQNTPRVDLFNQTLCPPSQDAWDMTVTPSLYPLFPFRKKQSQYSDIQKKSQYWECCLIAFRRQIWDPESVWPGHISTHKLNCDQAKDDTLHTFFSLPLEHNLKSPPRLIQKIKIEKYL